MLKHDHVYLLSGWSHRGDPTLPVHQEFFQNFISEVTARNYGRVWLAERTVTHERWYPSLRGTYANWGTASDGTKFVLELTRLPLADL